MKDKWQNLSLREKQTLALGSLFLGILLFYFLIALPVQNATENLRSKIMKEQKLLIWMQTTDKQIQESEKNLQPISHKNTSLLTVVQSHINKTAFVSNLIQLKQTDNELVQVSFSHVDFDKLMSWLIQLWREEGVTISQISVVENSTPGLVDVEMRMRF